MLLAFQQGLNYGVRQTLWVLAGLSFGLLILLLSVLLGIDVISRQMPWLLTVVKVVGALYLAYLGVQSWRHADDTAEFKQASAKPSKNKVQATHYDNDVYGAGASYAMHSAGEPALAGMATAAPNSRAPTFAMAIKTPWQRFRQGVWVSLSNPKAILFFAAFFPKFIDFNTPLVPQYVLLTLALFVSETTWQMIYTVGGTKLANWLGSGSRLLWLNRICGIIFLIIAVALIGEVATSL
ncbi:LysE family translocator [Psychrobacter arenosus]